MIVLNSRRILVLFLTKLPFLVKLLILPNVYMFHLNQPSTPKLIFLSLTWKSLVRWLLGVIVSSDLKWSYHYNSIISKTYKSLALLWHTFSSRHCPLVKLHLYTTLVRPHLTYCSQIWRPYLIKDILSFERIQNRATKFILNNRHHAELLFVFKIVLLIVYYLL